MVNTNNSGVDLLSEATHGRLHWNDPGMDDLEKGWEDFPIGTRVEVRISIIPELWKKGTVVETWKENERGIVVICDEKWHENLEFYNGRGASVPVFMCSRRSILWKIRKIYE